MPDSGFGTKPRKGGLKTCERRIFGGRKTSFGVMVHHEPPQVGDLRDPKGLELLRSAGRAAQSWYGIQLALPRPRRYQSMRRVQIMTAATMMTRPMVPISRA